MSQEKLERLATLLNEHSASKGHYPGEFIAEDGTLVLKSQLELNNEDFYSDPQSFYFTQFGKLQKIALSKEHSEERDAVRAVFNKMIGDRANDEEFWKEFPIYKPNNADTRPLSEEEWNDRYANMRLSNALDCFWNEEARLAAFAKTSEGLGIKPPVEMEFKKRERDEIESILGNEAIAGSQPFFAYSGLPTPSLAHIEGVSQYTQNPLPLYDLTMRFDKPFDVDAAIAAAENHIQSHWQQKLDDGAKTFLALVEQAREHGVAASSIATTLRDGIIGSISEKYSAGPRHEFAKTLNERSSRPSAAR